MADATDTRLRVSLVEGIDHSTRSQASLSSIVANTPDILMARADQLRTAEPHITVDLTLYPTEKGGRVQPIRIGWGSPCTIQSEMGSGWVGYDGWPLLLDGLMYPGETRRVGYVFLLGKEAVDYLKSAPKFYILERRLVGEAKIISTHLPED